jgi:hypothetical protein
MTLVDRTPEISANPLGAVPSAEAPKNVEGLWFDDGNLIIRAENTEFKVYRNLLAAHSSAIAGMIAASTPDMKDGCAFVHLSDNAIDVEYFLKALFDFRCACPSWNRCSLRLRFFQVF